MIKCKDCGKWLIEEGDSIPEPDRYYYKSKRVKMDGKIVTQRYPVVESKYPEGFCHCDIEEAEEDLE
jgi:hypothetical protein